MDPRQLRVLVELAELGTLRAVAAANGYGTSAVSQQLAGLERAVRARLVEPDGRRLRLTPAGHKLLPHARRILTAIDAAAAGLAADAEPSGTIRVAAYGTALAADLLPVALELRTSHPALRLELQEREPAETMRLLRTGQIELGFTYNYSLVPRQIDPMTVGQVLCGVPMMLAVPRAAATPMGPVRPQRIRDSGDLAALRAAPWIVNSRGEDDDELARRFCALAGFEPDVTHRVDNLDVVQQLVAAGLGVGLVPALVRPHPGTRLVPITLAPLVRRMLAVTRAGHADWPATALVSRLVAERARGHLRAIGEG
ncbi:MAG TPA: LysR family transcriptional regulator [Jiangellales bacterium]|nr:LysR family transcriptional regulator [Jiangellales bacterium]